MTSLTLNSKLSDYSFVKSDQVSTIFVQDSLSIKLTKICHEKEIKALVSGNF